MTAHANLSGKLVGVDDVELGVLLGKEVLHAVRHDLIKGRIVHIGVEKKVPPSLRLAMMSKRMM
jgi:hypothetical protein